MHVVFYYEEASYDEYYRVLLKMRTRLQILFDFFLVFS
jgi:hypothetical protein